MTFGESIGTCFSHYANFDGRASKTEFWWFILFTVLVGSAFGVFSEPLAAVFNLGVLLPSLAVGARRLHDTNRSGWLQFLFNAMFLAVFLPLAERLYGPWVWMLYFVSGVVGQLVNYSWLPEGGGSSTAAFGLMGSLMAYVLWRRHRMAKVTLLLAFHNHQPDGNFDDVFARGYDDCYHRLLCALDEAPHIRCTLHHTGPLFEWIDSNNNRYYTTDIHGGSIDQTRFVAQPGHIGFVIKVQPDQPLI